MEPIDRYVELQRGLRLHVLEWGSPHAPVVVMVHGWMDIARSWDPVAEHLAARYRVLAVDLRGHGHSSWIGAGAYYHFPDYLLDIDAVVREFAGHERVVLVGHSMGGMACGLFSGTFPERVRGYVSVEGLGPGAMRFDDAPDHFAEWVRTNREQLAKQPRPYTTIADAAAQLRHANPRLAEARSLVLATHGTERGDDGLYRWRFDPLHKSRTPQPFYVDQARAFWRRITAPVLVVIGKASWVLDVVPDWRERMSAIADARVVEIEDAGHMIHHERPDELAAAIEEFLATLPP